MQLSLSCVLLVMLVCSDSREADGRSLFDPGFFQYVLGFHWKLLALCGFICVVARARGRASWIVRLHLACTGIGLCLAQFNLTMMSTHFVIRANVQLGYITFLAGCGCAFASAVWRAHASLARRPDRSGSHGGSSTVAKNGIARAAS